MSFCQFDHLHLQFSHTYPHFIVGDSALALVEMLARCILTRLLQFTCPHAALQTLAFGRECCGFVQCGAPKITKLVYNSNN